MTGPESTGKTTLCKTLAKHLKIDWVEEYARIYLEKTNGLYSYSDLELMAKASEKILLGVNQKLVLADTDILTYKIWSENKFNRTSHWIEDQLRKLSNRLYILSYPDMPWEPDPLRENPDDRLDLFRQYEALLFELNLPYFILSGNRDVRQATAIGIATNYLKY